MFKFITTGESHGPALTAVIEGLPAGLSLDIDLINADLARRQKGYGRGGRMKIECDRVEAYSGIRFGKTIGSPVTFVIHNRDWANWQDRMAPVGEPRGEKVTAPRPGHADLPGMLKYQREDIRDILERASARETAARVAVGAVAKQVLALVGIQVVSHVTNIGGVSVAADLLQRTNASDIMSLIQSSELACIDPQAENSMKEAIRNARDEGNSLGGIFEVIVTGVFPGLGSHIHWDRRLDSRLAGALMSIQAVKGVEIGDGFGYAGMPGSKAHDEIFYQQGTGYYRKTNHAGGIEGGISNGQDIVVRAVMKPIPTLMTPLLSVDICSKAPIKANTERSDVCAVTAAAVVGETMAAIVLAGAILEKFGGDSIDDFLQSVDAYRQRIRL
ncbi:MAG TPA: chorismate synthase [Methylomusa anaerophila]|uniref:Chorismate synthase n=1 Tax=Methylomusa anaerophila TaxID=1930071 RepID=A0A348AQG4_9FIRM|nr:chorismate synthase [Methylomusa anaerophila]BBB93312.1 chorismate synthase [Methylomusa anaerophila]HML86857.1 chorismate synthase [Methylomusa anaerophila]